MKRRLGRLRRKFLPADFDPTGTYPGDQADKTFAYRLLSHAEIEASMEIIALQTVVRACDRWDRTRKVSLPLLTLVAYCGDASKEKEGASLSDRVATAKENYSNDVTRNNGIRAWNVRVLLLPAGVGEHHLGSTWLATISSFGKLRGETAHGQTTVTNPDPKSELDMVTDIVDGLERIDAILTELRR
ncbi:MAG: hypothetical protein IH959_07880 [Chloroflexi bacterium]|nr:hypothetical protein [Chloroflexota bacterium]